MWALDVLGLPGDADERAIKRAYARQLKQTQPDVDPEGFQRLHDAYRYALDHSRDLAWQDDVETDRTHEEPLAETTQVSAELQAPSIVDGEPPLASHIEIPTPSVVPTEPAVEPPAHAASEVADEGEALDLPAFLDDCIAHLTQDDPASLRRWLEAQPVLWSLQMKPHIGRWLLQALDERAPAMPAANFDEMLRFFDMDHVLSGVDAWFLHSLRAQLRLRHELLPGHEYDLANRVAAGTAYHERLPLVRRAMRQLRKPFSWDGALWFALPYGRAPQMLRIVNNLDDGRIDRLGETIDVRQAQFWLDAGDTSRMSTARRAVVMARCAAVVWAVGLMALAVRWLVADIAPHERGAEALQAALLLAGGPVLAYALWEAWHAVRAYVRWQCAPEGTPVRWPMLRLLWVPLLAGLAVVDYQLGYTAAAAWLGLLACVTGLLRLGGRANLRLSFVGWRILFVLPFLKGIFGLGALAIVYPFVSAGLGTTFWLIDAIRHARVLWNDARSRFARAAADSGT